VSQVRASEIRAYSTELLYIRTGTGAEHGGEACRVRGMPGIRTCPAGTRTPQIATQRNPTMRSLADFLVVTYGMSLPRQVLPGQFYMITRRCTQRQFLLRPDAATNNAFTYCLIDAAQRFQMEVLLPCAMSNHYHVVVFDRRARYPEFVEHFHKMLARSQNALRGRWENFWSSEQVSVVRLAWISTGRN